jgi:hypothetical protein
VENAKQIAGGFPTGLRDDVSAVVDRLPEARHLSTMDPHHVSVGGEEILLPARIYNAVPAATAVDRMSDVQRLIAACIYSRHNDGHVREAACARILPYPEPWVAPYVVQLLGEYVVEICALILERLSAQSSFDWSSYRDFVSANRAYVELTRQRAISYWACYYRLDMTRGEYPALVALDRLQQSAAAA